MGPPQDGGPDLNEPHLRGGSARRGDRASIGASGLEAKDGEHLFLADSPEDYIKVLEILTDQEGMLHKTGLKARQFVKENFDILALSEKLIAFYKEQLT